MVKKVVWPVFLLAIILLVLVLLPLPHGITRRINGAHRWFSLPGMRLQPSELGKLALIFALAWYTERSQRFMHTWWRGIVVPGMIVAPILGLIFVEPDRGTTILMAAVSGGLPQRLRASGMALVTTATGLSRLAGSLMFGWLWNAWGLETAVAAFAVTLACALALSAPMWHRLEIGRAHV